VLCCPSLPSRSGEAHCSGNAKTTSPPHSPTESATWPLAGSNCRTSLLVTRARCRNCPAQSPPSERRRSQSQNHHRTPGKRSPAPHDLERRLPSRPFPERAFRGAATSRVSAVGGSCDRLASIPVGGAQSTTRVAVRYVPTRFCVPSAATNKAFRRLPLFNSDWIRYCFFPEAKEIIGHRPAWFGSRRTSPFAA
jgi:hypothetical protein